MTKDHAPQNHVTPSASSRQCTAAASQPPHSRKESLTPSLSLFLPCQLAECSPYLGFVWVCQRRSGSNWGPKDVTGLPARWVQTLSSVHRCGFIEDAASLPP